MIMNNGKNALALLLGDLDNAATPTKAVPPTPVERPKTVLLTGATSFIGVHILSRLVSEGLEVVCLLRGDSKDDARMRLTEVAWKWGVAPQPIEETPIVLGDCTQPSLGLSAADRDRLAAEVDTVVHFAMRGGYHTPYARFRKHWLACLHELIALCLTGRNKSLHVAGSFNTHFLDDEVQLRRLETSAWHSGYSAYKLVAMRTLEAYQAAGAHFVWYDLPLAIGDEDHAVERSDYGAFQIMDLFLRLRVIFEFSLQAVTPSLIAEALFHNAALGRRGCRLVRPVACGVFTALDLQEFLGEQGVGHLPILDSGDARSPELSRMQRFLVPKDFSQVQKRVHCQSPAFPPGFRASREYDAGRLIRANASMWSPLKVAAGR
jgi:hypothetical protein